LMDSPPSSVFERRMFHLASDSFSIAIASNHAV
jgi:hypothetical protein